MMPLFFLRFWKIRCYYQTLATLKREASLQHFLRKLKEKNVFNEKKYNKFDPFGSAPTHIYGTPKMYNFSSSDSFPELRPIVSSIGTFNYNLARFLCDLLSPLVPNDYSCKDTFSFVSQIKNASLSRKCLVSYDVTSFFTNILLQETIDIGILYCQKFSREEHFAVYPRVSRFFANRKISFREFLKIFSQQRNSNSENLEILMNGIPINMATA